MRGWDVLDNDGLTEKLSHSGRKDTAEHIKSAACSEGHHQRARRSGSSAGRHWNFCPSPDLPSWEEQMSKYYFDVRNGHRLVDPSGLDCESEKDAMTKAKVIAEHIAGDVPHPSTPRKIAVMNSDRQEVDHVNIHDDTDAEPGDKKKKAAKKKIP